MDKPLDLEQSVQLEQKIRSKSRQYFNNAFRAVLEMPTAEYVQGFVVVARHPYTPLEHAWLELPDCYLDPNFKFLNCKVDQVTYFPAQRLSAAKLKAAVEEAREDYPEDDPLPIYGAMPYEYYGDIMLGGKPYLEAFNQAEAYAQSLQQALRSQADQN